MHSFKRGRDFNKTVKSHSEIYTFGRVNRWKVNHTTVNVVVFVTIFLSFPKRKKRRPGDFSFSKKGIVTKTSIKNSELIEKQIEDSGSCQI
jgi:hypothetical protein